MTLAKIIDTLKMIALKHPNVNSAYEGNIYDILNAKPDNKYASVVITQQSHTTDETYDHYGFVIFYVDRLVDDLEENRVQIQSIGKSMLGNIITAFCNEFEAECDNILYQPFTQRFTDETAGVYCTITIDVIKDGYCAERYWDESWSAPIVSIKNVDMSITITENGHYVLDYDPTIYTGIGKVDIEVALPTKISVRDLKLKFKGSMFTTVPEIFDFNGVTDMANMFADCQVLADISNLYGLDLSENKSFTYVFSVCYSLTDVGVISSWTYPIDSDWGTAFTNASNLISVPAIHTEGKDNYYQGAAFWNYNEYQNLTDFGGYIGLKYSMTKSYCFERCVNFTHQTLLNILNGLYDFTGNGETPESNQGQIAFPQVLMDKLSEEDILIAINKGWQLLTL